MHSQLLHVPACHVVIFRDIKTKLDTLKAYYEIIRNSTADIHQQEPDNIRSHTARLTKMMYFNKIL